MIVVSEESKNSSVEKSTEKAPSDARIAPGAPAAAPEEKKPLGKGQRIAHLSSKKAQDLITQGIITDGMIVKVRAALDAAQTLGRPVDIASWRYPELLPALFDGEAIGTRISAES